METPWDRVDPAKFLAFTDAQREASREIFDTFSDVANVTYLETSNGDALANFDLDSGLAGGVGSNGRLWIDTAFMINSANDFGTFEYSTLVHEIGHFSGLEHPGNYDASTGRATYADDALYHRDTIQYSVMSYFDETNLPTGNFGSSYSATPMLHDILALQALYGANTTTRTGDNTYGYNASGSGMRDVFDFDQNQRPVLTIYDRGGFDTLDLSQSVLDVKLDLRPMSFSDTHGMVGNIAIGPDTVIEIARGGSGNDHVIGNDSTNVLYGGDGLDSLHGGNGNDWLFGNDGQDSLVGGNGTDRLYGGAGNDVLNGEAGTNYLYGQDGDDIIFASTGGGIANGGTGSDLVSFYYAPSNVTADLQSGQATGKNLSLTMRSIERIYGSNQADQIYGSDGDDQLTGWGGADMIEGRDGNDRLSGNLGNDRLVGGSGNDSLDGGSGNDVLIGGAGSDRLDGGTGIDMVDYRGSQAGVIEI